MERHSQLATCWPHNMLAAPTLLQGDPFKTLFVSRLSYDVTERKLKREFEEYGPIKRIRLVHDKNSGGCRDWLAVFGCFWARVEERSPIKRTRTTRTRV